MIRIIRITVNEPGTTTLADARPMVVNGEGVYVTIEGGIASLHVDGGIATQMDADDMTTAQAQAWAVEYLTKDIPSEPDMDAVNEALYGPAVKAVHATGAILATEALQLTAEAKPGPYRYTLAIGRKVTIPESDPRHPLNLAYAKNLEADILSAWTSADESGYVRYVSDGLADTDGTFFPMGRASWKATQD